MLQAIRERSQGLIVAIIVGFIILTFALWGVESYINAARQVVVAEVEGEQVYLQEFQEYLQRYRRQAQAMLGDAFDDADWSSVKVRREVLDQLVEDKVLAAVVDDSRLRVSDRQVAAQLQQLPAFQDENGFSRALYEQRLPMIGMSQAGFEQQLRLDMEKSQLRAGVAASEFVTRNEAELIERLRKQTRDIGYAIIPASALESALSLSDGELEAWYGEHKEDFREPERVRLEYVEISPLALQADVAVDDKALHAYYDANKAAFTAEEQRNVNHILIHVPADADADTDMAALERARQALERARSGESFEDLAKELSDDVGSRTEGGETGLFGRGVMAPEFEQAAFALAEVGDISEPVKTKFGYHIIKLKAIEPGGLKPFDEVRDQVERDYRAAEAQKMFFDQAEQFSNLVYEHPDSLDAAAEALNLETHQTDLLSRKAIAKEFSEKVATAAFETEVLVDGLNSEPVELDDGRVVAVRVSEHQPSTIPPLDKVHEAARAALQTERLRERTRAAGDAIIERLRGGASVADTVEADGYDWLSVTAARRESDKVNRAVLRAAFRAEIKGDQPTYTGVAIGKADYAVVRVAEVKTPPADELNRGDVTQVQQDMMSARAALTWEAFVDELRAHSDVTVYDKNL